MAHVAQHDAVAKGLDGRGVQHDLALLGVVLGVRQVVDEGTGEDVDELDVGIPDDEAPRVADGHGDLEGELDRRAAGRGDQADPGHRLLHRDGGRGRARAVVTVEPAGDGIAGEIDDVAAASVELLDDGVEDAAEVRGQLLGAALRPELVRPGLRSAA